MNVLISIQSLLVLLFVSGVGILSAQPLHVFKFQAVRSGAEAVSYRHSRFMFLSFRLFVRALLFGMWQTI